MAVLGLAITALFAGVLALGQATSPDEKPAIDQDRSAITFPEVLLSPTTTVPETTFSIADIATGERFFWVKAPPGGRVWPIDLVTHGGQVFLFGSEQMSPSGSGGLGLRAWVSADGVEWDLLGEVVDDDHEVTRVLSTGPGLVVLGSSISSGEPVIWTSANGLSWARATLPTGTQAPGARYRLNDAVVFQGHLRVVGVQTPDPEMDVLASLPASLIGTDLRSVQVSFEIGGEVDTSIVHIYGPLGLHAFSTGLSDLGLHPAIETALIDRNLPSHQYLWSLSQESGWSSTELTAPVIENLWVSPGGVLVAYGSSISTTQDGSNWVTHGRSSREPTLDIEAGTPWQSSLIGVGGDVLATSDGIAWQRMGAGELLPEEIKWALGPMGAGSAGLAIIAGVDRSSAPAQPEPVNVELGDVELTLDLAPGSLLVDKPGYQPLEVPLWDRRTEAPYTIDFLQRIVTFIDPASGAELLAVGFSTLEEVMAAALATGAISERALLFAPDGGSWTAQDISNVVAAENEIVDVEILQDRVLLLTRERVGEGGVPPRVTIVIGQIDP